MILYFLFRWSECSRSCGGGIRSSKRNCTNPTPQGGGLYCIGSRVRYESCNTWECPRGSQDPRLQQCQKFNGNNFKISGIPSDVQWVPKYTSSMRMFLYSSKSDVLYNVNITTCQYQNPEFLYFLLKFEVPTVANSFAEFKIHQLIIFLVLRWWMGLNVEPIHLMLASRDNV